MSGELHISSLVVSANPSKLVQIESELNQLDILEIAHVEKPGKIIVTLETVNQSEIVQVLNDVQLIDGVVCAGMVFHQVIAPDDVADIEAIE